jgi:L-fuculose-phosphate aldolase
MMNQRLIRLQLCDVMRKLYSKDLISSIGGNASFIIKDKNTILITPSGFEKENLKPVDIIEILLNGEIIGKGLPSSEKDTHLNIYRKRSDVKAIVHAHPPYTLGVISSGIIPSSITPEQVIMANDLEVMDYISDNILFIEKLIKNIEKSNTIVVKNHGIFSLGNNLNECFTRIEVLEAAFKIVAIQKIFGNVNTLNLDQIKNINEKYGHKKPDK